MGADNHRTYIYIGLGGEGEYIGAGGLYRCAADDGEWKSITRKSAPRPVCSVTT